MDIAKMVAQDTIVRIDKNKKFTVFYQEQAVATGEIRSDETLCGFEDRNNNMFDVVIRMVDGAYKAELAQVFMGLTLDKSASYEISVAAEKADISAQNNSAGPDKKKESSKGLTDKEIQNIIEERINFLQTGKISGVDFHTGRNLVASGLAALVGWFGFVPLLVVWYFNNTFLDANSVPLFKFLSMDNNGDNMGISILVSLGIVGLALFGVCCLIALIFTGGLNGPDFTKKYEEECEKTKKLVLELGKHLQEDVTPEIQKAEITINALHKENTKLEKALKTKEENFGRRIKELSARNKENEKVALSLMKENDDLRAEQNLLRRQLGNVQEDCKAALRKKENELDEMAHKNNLLRADLEHLRAKNQGE